jgi:hypothetical protein
MTKEHKSDLIKGLNFHIKNAIDAKDRSKFSEFYVRAAYEAAYAVAGQLLAYGVTQEEVDVLMENAIESAKETAEQERAEMLA